MNNPGIVLDDSRTELGAVQFGAFLTPPVVPGRPASRNSNFTTWRLNEVAEDPVVQAGCDAPALPHHLLDLFDRDERYDVLPNDLAAVQAYVAERMS